MLSWLSHRRPTSQCTTSLSKTLLTTLLLTATMSTANGHARGNFDLQLRRSDERGRAHGIPWLNSYHSFSFAEYWDPQFSQFNALRVLNEDRVKARNGFPTHPHREAEIYSYIVSGQLKHQDSLGSSAIMKRGDIQHTTGGTGISHSEGNPSADEIVHFLQIWMRPSVPNAKPSYQFKSFSDDEKLNTLLPIVTESGHDGKTVKINAHSDTYASLLDHDAVVKHKLRKGREYYLHVVQDVTSLTSEAHITSLIVDDGQQEVELKSGDAALIRNVRDGSELVLKGQSTKPGKKRTEFLLFDLQKL